MKEQIGKLDRRITFIDPHATEEDEWGEIIPGRKEIAIVWAKVLELRGKEKRKAGKDFATMELDITCRYRSNITTDLIIEYQGRELEILSVNELGRRRYLEIVALENKTKRGVN